MVKKILLIIFILIISIMILGNMKVLAAEYNGIFEYTENSDNTVSITKLLDKDIEELEIPEQIDGKTVTRIGGYFSENSIQGKVASLKKITIPATVQEAGSNFYNAFKFITNLEEIVVKENNKYLCSVDGVLYSKNKDILISYPANREGSTYNILDTVKTIKTYAFYSSKKLDTLNIPNSVTTIDDGAFALASVRKLNFPETIEKVPTYACYECPNLEEVVINVDGLIEYDAFQNCTKLKNVYFGEKCTNIMNEAFEGCTSLSNVNFDTCNIISIYEGAFKNCTSLPKTIKLNEKMYKVAKNAFDSDINIEFTNSQDVVELTDCWERCIKIKAEATQNYTEAYKVFDLVNEKRKEQNLPELRLDKVLTDIAMQRAYEISIYYAHRRPESYRWFSMGGNDASQFFEDTIYRMGLNEKVTYTYIGENIAAWQQNAEQVMNSWMNSQGHKENILNENYTSIGVGAVKAYDGYYWVQFFTSGTPYTEEKERSNVTETRLIPCSKSYVGSFEDESGIKLTSNKTTLNVGDTGEIKVKSNFMYSNATTTLDPTGFEWKSSNNKVLKVDNQGKITAISSGTADIIITMSEGTTKKITITVKALKGDVNGDGKVSTLDYGLILSHVKKTQKLEGEMLKRADVNGDEKVSTLDYGLVLSHVMRTDTLF